MIVSKKTQKTKKMITYLYYFVNLLYCDIIILVFEGDIL